MSSSGSGKRVVGGRGEKDVVSSRPPAARTRAQTRADRTKTNLNVISPRSTTVKATIASSGPRGISLRGVPVEEISSATARNKLRAGIYSPTLGSPVTSPTARTAPVHVACADDIPAPPPMNMARLKVNPYAGRRAYRRTSNVASATAALTSRTPTTHAVTDSEMFIALRDAVTSLRIACDDPHPRGRGARQKCLERHVLLAVRLISPQAPSIRSRIADAFAQGSRPCYVYVATHYSLFVP